MLFEEMMTFLLWLRYKKDTWNQNQPHKNTHSFDYDKIKKSKVSRTVSISTFFYFSNKLPKPGAATFPF